MARAHRALADGTILDLRRLTLERQADSNAGYPAGRGPSDLAPLRPRAHRPAAALGVIRSPVYVVLWIADDVDDGDGDPLRDSNGALLVRAEAFGLRGVRRRIDATLARDDGGEPIRGRDRERTEVRMICWREVR